MRVKYIMENNIKWLDCCIDEQVFDFNFNLDLVNVQFLLNVLIDYFSSCRIIFISCVWCISIFNYCVDIVEILYFKEMFGYVY